MHIYENFLDRNDRLMLHLALTNKNMRFIAKKRRNEFDYLGILSKALHNKEIELSSAVKHFIRNKFQDDENEKKGLLKIYPCLSKTHDKCKKNVQELIKSDTFDELDMKKILSSCENKDMHDVQELKNGKYWHKMTPRVFDIAYKYLSEFIRPKWSRIVFMTFGECNEELIIHIRSFYPHLWEIKMTDLEQDILMILGNNSSKLLCKYATVSPHLIKERIKKSLENMMMEDYFFYADYEKSILV